MMHSIDTGDQPPVRQLPRRIPFAFIEGEGYGDGFRDART